MTHRVIQPLPEFLHSDELPEPVVRPADLRVGRSRVFRDDDAAKPFLWADKKHVCAVTWVVVFGIAILMTIAFSSAGVYFAKQWGWIA